MKCSICKTDNQTGELFCANCGFFFASATTNTGSTLTPNAQLQNGRYVVEKILGQGGMGTAALAKDTRVSNKRVVIKELVSASSDPKQQQEDLRNFEREVDMLASLNHPLIPSVSDK